MGEKVLDSRRVLMRKRSPSGATLKFQPYSLGEPVRGPAVRLFFAKRIAWLL